MSRNGSGIYNLPAGNPVVTGTVISSTWANNTLTDIASALTGSVAADGQTPMTGDLDMNTNKIVNLEPGTVAGNAVEYTQLTNAFIDPTITGDLTVTGNVTVGLNGTFSGTGALKVPSGTTVQQPVSPVNGMIRYNTTTKNFEGYIDGAWGQIGGSAQANGAVYENKQTISANYTMTTNYNGESVGPITIENGVTVTIPTNSRWVVL